MKITLCGSLKFKEEFVEWNMKLSLAGHVVYSVADVGTKFEEGDGREEEKVFLDLIHFAKIEESDAIFVIDVNGYTGYSTNREIAWARLRGKTIFKLSKEIDVDHLLTFVQRKRQI